MTDSSQEKRMSVMACGDTKILTGKIMAGRKRFCTVGVLLICFICIYFHSVSRTETEVYVKDYITSAPVVVAQTEESIKYRPDFTSGINNRFSSMFSHSKQRSNTATSIPTNSEIKHDKEILEQNNELSDRREPADEKGRDLAKQYLSFADTNLNLTNIKPNGSDRQTSETGQQNENLEYKVHSNRRIVLIVTYMRSGSTFTGSVFQEYPGAFYIFEPLRLLHQAFKSSKLMPHVEIEYVNGTKRNYSPSERVSTGMNELNAWVDCRFGSISKASLVTGLHRHFIKYNNKFNNCGKNRISYSCLKKSIRSCKKTPLLALKIIRMRMEEVAALLPFYPNMKIIHLVRDPRGMFNSRMNSESVGTNNYKETVQNHCKKVKADLKYSRQIQQTYSNKLKILHYEDLAEKPFETARSLIEFVGLKFVKSVRDHMEQQTNAEHDAGAFDTRRKNSTETANKWRSEIDSEIAQYIYKECSTSNIDLGYLPLLSDEMLRNLEIPSRKAKT